MASCDSTFFLFCLYWRIQLSYFYLEDYLPQTLGSVVFILFSFFDISESDPSPKGEFSRPQKQELVTDTIRK